MVYLLKIVIFHGELLNNQRVLETSAIAHGKAQQLGVLLLRFRPVS